MRAIRQFCQAVALLQELFLLQFRKLELGDAVAEFVSLLLRIVVLSQLIGNRLHLLAQEIFPLILIDLLLGLLADLAFDLKDLHFTLQDLHELVQAFDRGELLQNALFLFIIEHDIGSVKSASSPQSFFCTTPTTISGGTRL